MKNLKNEPGEKKVMLLGVKIDSISIDQLLNHFQRSITNKEKAVISYANVHAMNIAYAQPWFRAFLTSSRVTFCDGVGIQLAAWLMGQPLKYRYTPPDFIHRICEQAVQNGWRIFFLGARPGVAQKAADMLITRFPGLVVLTHHGYFEKSAGSLENQQVVESINQFRPHLLILGFGMPMQERWILENLATLQVNIAFPAGALFDYVSESLPRAPRWITDNGLEWLARLVVEPRRLWKRYLIGNPLFYWRIFLHHILHYPLPG